MKRKRHDTHRWHVVQRAGELTDECSECGMRGAWAGAAEECQVLREQLDADAEYERFEAELSKREHNG